MPEEKKEKKSIFPIFGSSTKVEKKDKKFFIVTGQYEESSWVEFVSDNYIAATTRLRMLKHSCNGAYHDYHLLIQYENGEILPCNEY